MERNRKGIDMEKIKKYVERFFQNQGKNSRYEMSFDEIEQGMEEIFCIKDANGAFYIITTFFNFGYAKGYRAAMAKMKKGGAE